MLRIRRPPRKIVVAFVPIAAAFSVFRGPAQASAGPHARPGAGPVSAVTLAATSPATSPSGDGGLCGVPGIGDIGGLLGFCSLGSSGLTGTLNNLCQPGVPQPESATT